MSEGRAGVLPFGGSASAPQPRRRRRTHTVASRVEAAQVAASVRDGGDATAEGDTLAQPELSEDMVQELGRIVGEMFIAEYRGEHGPMGKTRSGN